MDTVRIRMTVFEAGALQEPFAEQHVSVIPRIGESVILIPHGAAGTTLWRVVNIIHHLPKAMVLLVVEPATIQPRFESVLNVLGYKAVL